MNKDEAKSIINNLFVDAFNNILFLEERYIKERSEENVTITEIHVIEAIDQNKKKSMGSIAKRLMITEGTLTTSVNKLIKKGLVEKIRDPQDKRVFLLSVTEKGHKILEIHKHFHDVMVDFVLKDNNIEHNENLVYSLNSLKLFFEDLKSRYKNR